MTNTGEVFCILANEEEQYSLWPDNLDLPAGWTKIDFTGTKEDCLQHINEIWVDMRPKSIRD